MKKTDRRILYIAAPALIGVLAIVALVFFAGQETPTNDKVGTAATGILLAESRGGTVDLDDVIGKKTAVLVFYRGNW